MARTGPHTPCRLGSCSVQQCHACLWRSLEHSHHSPRGFGVAPSQSCNRQRWAVACRHPVASDDPQRSGYWKNHGEGEPQQAHAPVAGGGDEGCPACKAAVQGAGSNSSWSNSRVAGAAAEEGSGGGELEGEGRHRHRAAPAASAKCEQLWEGFLGRLGGLLTLVSGTALTALSHTVLHWLQRQWELGAAQEVCQV
jgi:hypothetical protein